MAAHSINKGQLSEKIFLHSILCMHPRFSQIYKMIYCLTNFYNMKNSSIHVLIRTMRHLYNVSIRISHRLLLFTSYQFLFCSIDLLYSLLEIGQNGTYSFPSCEIQKDLIEELKRSTF